MEERIEKLLAWIDSHLCQKADLQLAIQAIGLSPILIATFRGFIDVEGENVVLTTKGKERAERQLSLEIVS